MRDLLKRGTFVQAPGAYDALTAKLTEAAGFPAVYMSGYGTAAGYGVTDTGVIGLPEMLANATRMARATDIPLIADADTGYADPAETTRLYESAGVAAIQIEDQVWPKKCGHMPGKAVVDAETMCDRIRSAASARQSGGILIIARTDAIAVEGLEAALERAERYAAAGADILFVEAPESLEQLQDIPRRLPGIPHLYNAAPRTPYVRPDDLAAFGYAIAIYPGIAFTATMLAARSALEELRTDGTQSNLETWRAHFEEWNAFLEGAS